MAPKRGAGPRRPAAKAHGLRRPAVTGRWSLGTPPTSAVPGWASTSWSGLRFGGALLWSPGPGSWPCAWCLLGWGEMYIELETIGTKDDELLRVLSGTPGKKLSIHVCSESCAGALTDPLLIHGRAWLKLIWRGSHFSNLEAASKEAEEPGTDELAKLRELQERRMEDQPEGEKNWRRRKRRGGMNGSSLVKRGGRQSLPSGMRRIWRLARRPWRTSMGRLVWIQTLLAGRGSWRRLGALGKLRRRRKEELIQFKVVVDRIAVHQVGFQKVYQAHQDFAAIPRSSHGGAVREARHGLLSGTGDTAPCGVTGYDPRAPNLATGRRLHAEGKGGSGSRHSRDYCKGLPLEYTGRQLELVRSDQFSVSEGSEALGTARRARGGEAEESSFQRTCSQRRRRQLRWQE